MYVQGVPGLVNYHGKTNPCIVGSLLAQYYITWEFELIAGKSCMDAFEKIRYNGIKIDKETITVIARKYGIKELSVFGSSIRDDFNENSDIDFLVVFDSSKEISLFDLLEIEQYFEDKLGRRVDLVEADGLVNPIRKKEILNTKMVLYVA